MSTSRPPLARAGGFTVAEWLVAATITLVLLGALVRLVAAAHATFGVEPARIELRQRARAAEEIIGGDLWSAGAGPAGALDGAALGAWVPTLLPCRLGSRSADPPGTSRTDILTIVSASAGMAAARLRQAATPPGDTLVIDAAPPCPVADASCGLAVGMDALLVDGHGLMDLFGVAAVAGDNIRLQARGACSGWRYPAGAWLVPVDVRTYHVRAEAGSDGRQLMRYDGNLSDLPLLDHVNAITIEYFGDPEPPRSRSQAAPGDAVMTYGPPPPAAGVDDPRDGWGPGENCVVARAGDQPVPRLPVLGDGRPGLVALPASAFADGPWCPDASARSRVDADLLRVRTVRVTLALEATQGAYRGRLPALFARPGSASAVASVPDETVSFEVVPRSLGAGR